MAQQLGKAESIANIQKNRQVPGGDAAAQANARANDLQKQIDLANAMKAQGKNADGSPIRPGFQSLIDVKSGLLKSPYVLKGQPEVKLNTDGLEASRARALDQGPSQWAQLMEQKQGIEQQGKMDQLNQSEAKANASAYADLASHGGVDAAQRERIAGENAKQSMFQAQDLRRQGELDRTNIGIQDQQNKDTFLKALPGQELDALNPEFKNRDYSTQTSEYNVGNALTDINTKRQADLDAYKQQLQAWGSGQTADAQTRAAGAGKK